MGLGKNLLTEQLAAVTRLCKAEHSNQEISSFTGVNLRSFQQCAKVFRESSDGPIPLQKKPPVKAKKLTGH